MEPKIKKPGGAKKTKKHRKWGRNTRKPGSAKQLDRTAHNKALRMVRTEQLAGHRLPWATSPEVLVQLNILRFKRGL